MFRRSWRRLRDRWYNQTLCRVNDSVVRRGVMQGEYHWHKPNDLDEFFFTLDGTFLIDLEDRTVELGPRQGFVVPKGVVHRTRAPERCVILMVEGAGIVPTGDDDLRAEYREMATDGAREAEALEWSEALIGDVADDPG